MIPYGKLCDQKEVEANRFDILVRQVHPVVELDNGGNNDEPCRLEPIQQVERLFSKVLLDIAQYPLGSNWKTTIPENQGRCDRP